MTRTIWLCLRCGWRRPASYVADRETTCDHEDRCDADIEMRRIVRDGRITGGARSQP